MTPSPSVSASEPPDSGDNYAPVGSESLDDSQGSNSPPLTKRGLSEASMTTSARVRAGSRLSSESVCAAGKRLCLLTLNEVTPTDCCHVIPRSTKGIKLDVLEYAWGISPGNLNLDLPRNLFFLSTEFHRSFDRHDWVLVPTLRDLIKATAAASLRRPYLEVFAADEYCYTFVHLKGHPVRILRDEKTFALPYQAELCPYTAHYPPYGYFPPLLSQVHPYFVIYKATTAFQSLTGDQHRDFRAIVPDPDEPDSVVSRLLICRTIVDAWKQAFHSRPIPRPPTHPSAPSESRMKTRSRSSQHSAPSSSQPSGSQRNRSDRHRSQYQAQSPAAQEAQPSTVASHDSPHTPDHKHEYHFASFVHENPHSVGYHLDIADWAKSVTAHSINETPGPHELDTTKQSLVSCGEGRTADNHATTLD